VQVLAPRTQEVRGRLLLVAIATWLLVLASGSSAATGSPVLTLGPISVNANGVANVTGTVTGTLGGSTKGSVNVTLNGHPLGVNAAGTFAGSVDLGGVSVGGTDTNASVNANAVIQLDASNPDTGQTFSVRIPASLAASAPGGVLDGALQQLQSAGVSVVVPPGGFQSIDNGPVEVAVDVNKPGELASLSINGAGSGSGSNSSTGSSSGSGNSGSGSVSGAGGPGGSGSGSVGSTGSRGAKKVVRKQVVYVLPSSNGVSVAATDTHGVTEVNSYPVLHITSAIRTRAGTSVTAAGAQGLKISQIHYDLSKLQTTKRLGITVTLRDLRGYLVRDAAVTIGAARGAAVTISGRQSRISNRYGQAVFSVPLSKAVFSKRLFVGVTGRTPSAQAHRTASVKLPAFKRCSCGA
jgi:hypothetical protein